jgi:hypothetical protein
LPTVLDTKYESILSRERSLARAVAISAVKAKPITVWEVTIPVIFIFGYMRLKSTREIFTQNILFTKKLALEAALEMIKKGQPREEVMSRIEDKTSSLLISVKKGVYSEEIRQMQLKEIDLLINHYCRLLRAEGRDYASLVINAYKSQKDYSTFLGQLKETEKQVTRAAEQTLGMRTDHEIISRIEESTDRARMAEVEKIFSVNNPGLSEI